MKGMLQTLRNLFIAAIIMVGLPLAYAQYKAHAMATVCESLASVGTAAAAVERAPALGLRVFDRRDKQGEIFLMDHDVSMFRDACVLTIADGRITGHNSRAAY